MFEVLIASSGIKFVLNFMKIGQFFSRKFKWSAHTDSSGMS